MIIRCANPTCSAQIHIEVETQQQINKIAERPEGILRSVGWDTVIQDGAWVAICGRCAKEEQ